MQVYPVVHINNPETAVAQAETALDLGADGIYLIDHRTAFLMPTFETFNALDEQHPEAFIGVNILSMEPAFALQSIKHAFEAGGLRREPDALWTDDIIEGKRGHNTGEAKAFRDEMEMKTRILGGVAFKYTGTYTDDPETAARLTQLLKPHVDIVTTSGQKTGHAPSIEKIAAMKRQADGELAVASGIDIENITDYESYVDQILVASSVETEPYSGIFEKQKLHDLIQAAHDLAQ